MQFLTFYQIFHLLTPLPPPRWAGAFASAHFGTTQFSKVEFLVSKKMGGPPFQKENIETMCPASRWMQQGKISSIVHLS